MNDELKYCKFCDKEKPKNEFCKSGFAIKNICRECQNKKQKEKLNASKNWNELKKWLEERIDYLTEIDGQHIPLNDSFKFCSMNELYQTGKYSGLKDSLEKMQELENK